MIYNIYNLKNKNFKIRFHDSKLNRNKNYAVYFYVKLGEI